jgi:hypothetical protein
MRTRERWAWYVLGLITGLLAAVVFSSETRAAPTCTEKWVGMITVSRHIDPARKYNEEHWGPFLRCQRDERWSWQVGWYPNSYKRDTWYGLVNYVPVRVGPMFLGVSGGMGTGYAEHSDGRPRGGLSPLLGGVAGVHLDRRATFAVFFNTAVVAAIVEWRFE